MASSSERDEVMETTLIRHPQLTVQVETGSEGPRHDPYHFVETHVTTPNGTTVLHEGLGTWLKFNGKEFPTRQEHKGNYEAYELHLRNELFPRCTGWTITQLNRIGRRISNRCKCGSQRFIWESGYPGETFKVCVACHKIVASTFSRSAIE